MISGIIETDLETMMKLFYMDTVLKIFDDRKTILNIYTDSGYYSYHYYHTYPCYLIDRLFTENKFYLMIFALTLTRSIDEVRKFCSDASEKYKLLKQINYFPHELVLEISSHLIVFILMCMM